MFIGLKEVDEVYRVQSLLQDFHDLLDISVEIILDSVNHQKEILGHRR